MRGKTPMKLAVGVAAIALFAAGCSQATTTPPADDAGGELRIYASEPAFLVPTAADDDPAIQVIRQLYRGLVTYNSNTGAAENDLAEAITSTDNIHWTIKIKSGHTFTNGEAVDSDSFIRAWNYVAYGPNAQNNAFFVSRIKGIEKMSSTDPDGDGPLKAPDPESKELEGLKKVDASTFTVELNAPFSGFPATIGYSGFFPVAAACLADFTKCNENPIGNGPYKIEGSWQHDIGVTLVRNDGWKGQKGKADKLSYKIFADVNAGYAAFQAGELDVMYTIPSPKYKEAKAQYGEALYERPSNTYTYLGFPLWDSRFQNKKLRQAFSQAIDRQAIIDAVFDGRFSVAQGVVSPNFDGYRAGVCKFCKLDVTAAKAALAEAGGFTGKLTLWANAGAGHDAWLQAVGDQLKKNLGIDYELKINLQFPEYLAALGSKGVDGVFRLGWGPDYPVIETYLAPLYGTAGSSNNSAYTNPAFDELIKKGDGAPSPQAGIQFYQQAEDIIVEDLPILPMWFGKVTAVYGDKVGKFVYNPISGVMYNELTVKK